LLSGPPHHLHGADEVEASFLDSDRHLAVATGDAAFLRLANRSEPLLMALTWAPATGLPSNRN
jgi:hypothetical protein